MNSQEECIVLVHGTWGGPTDDDSGPKWFHQSHKFCDRLQTRFAEAGDDKKRALDIFTWSGENWEDEREAAANDLANYLQQKSKDKRPIHIVAHSHGGSVVWSALKKIASRSPSSDLAQSIRSWTTVGTPFLRYGADPRPAKWVWVLIPVILALILFGSGMFAEYTLGPKNVDEVIQALRDQSEGLAAESVGQSMESEILAEIADKLEEQQRSRSLTMEEAAQTFDDIYYGDEEETQELQVTPPVRPEQLVAVIHEVRACIIDLSICLIFLAFIFLRGQRLIWTAAIIALAIVGLVITPYAVPRLYSPELAWLGFLFIDVALPIVLLALIAIAFVLLVVAFYNVVAAIVVRRHHRSEQVAEREAARIFGCKWLGLTCSADEAFHALKWTTYLTVPASPKKPRQHNPFQPRVGFSILRWSRSLIDSIVAIARERLFDPFTTETLAVRAAKFLQGNSRVASVVFDATVNPVDELPYFPLPGDVVAEITKVADKSAADAVVRFRAIYGVDFSSFHNASVRKGSGLQEVFTGKELVHCSYFDNPFVTDRIADHVLGVRPELVNSGVAANREFRNLAKSPWQSVHLHVALAGLFGMAALIPLSPLALLIPLEWMSAASGAPMHKPSPVSVATPPKGE